MVKKDFRIKIIKENESLQVLFLDILGFTQLGEMNALDNEWVYKNNLIDVSIDLTPNDLRYLLEKIVARKDATLMQPLEM